MASFQVQAFSLDRLRTLNSDEIVERYRQFTELTRFGDWDPAVLAGLGPLGSP
jgi:hypothetical protein